MSDKKTLISLVDWERLADSHRWDTLSFGTIRDAPNGIACPTCRNELVDVDRNEVLTSAPPQYRIRCPACGWGGYRHIA